jgi:hypothetical protein
VIEQPLALAVDIGGDLLSQVRGAAIQLIVLAVVGIFSTVSAVFCWLVRRDLSRAAQEEAKRGLAHAALAERFEDHVRRSGNETKDIEYRLGILATQCQRVIPEVTIPEWPSR